MALSRPRGQEISPSRPQGQEISPVRSQGQEVSPRPQGQEISPRPLVLRVKKLAPSAVRVRRLVPPTPSGSGDVRRSSLDRSLSLLLEGRGQIGHDAGDRHK